MVIYSLRLTRRSNVFKRSYKIRQYLSNHQEDDNQVWSFTKFFTKLSPSWWEAIVYRLNTWLQIFKIYNTLWQTSCNAPFYWTMIILKKTYVSRLIIDSSRGMNVKILRVKLNCEEKFIFSIPLNLSKLISMLTHKLIAN